MALRVISHSPTINEIDVAINQQVKITFNEGVIPSSVDYTTFSVNDAGTYTSVPGTIGIEYNDSGIADTIVFTPRFTMSRNNKYSVYVYGKPDSVIGADEYQLDDTYAYSFITGTGLVYYTDAPGIASGELADYADALNTVTYSTGVLSILSTDPQHLEPNVETQLGVITIQFNGDITSSTSEISDLLTIYESPVLE